jgi:2-C-methyl-D-erythritol 4-phosphate cytidylyltransferase
VTAQHFVRGDVAVLVPAAGAGIRLGPGVPKALRDLGGVPLIVHAIRRLIQAPTVGCVIVAAPAGRVDAVRTMLAYEAPSVLAFDVVEGGDTRQASVAAALAATPTSFEIVLVHDAARALAPADLVERVAAAVRDGHPAVIPVLPLADTIKRVDESGHVVGTVDRGALRAVQTPQGFRRDVLEAAHGQAVDSLTDDAGLVERIGVPVLCVPGSPAALKITEPDDLAIAELLLRQSKS